MSQIVEELKHRNEWLENAVKLVTAGVVKPGVVAHTLERMLRNRPTNAVTYSDLDNAEYSDVSGVRQAENREWAKYRANIAALEAAIAKRREADKMLPILETIRELKCELHERQSVDYSGLLEVLRETREREDEEEPQERPQRGRPIYDLRYRILSNDKTDKEAFLEHFTNLARGKKGKDLGLIVTAAIEGGLMTKPTYGEVKTAVGDDIGSPSGYNRYAGNKNAFAKHEREAMIEKLKDY